MIFFFKLLKCWWYIWLFEDAIAKNELNLFVHIQKKMWQPFYSHRNWFNQFNLFLKECHRILAAIRQSFKLQPILFASNYCNFLCFAFKWIKFDHIFLYHLFQHFFMLRPFSHYLIIILWWDIFGVLPPINAFQVHLTKERMTEKSTRHNLTLSFLFI